MRKRLYLLVVLLLWACTTSAERTEVWQLSRVLFRDPDKYVLFVDSNNHTSPVEVIPVTCINCIKVYEDVPEGSQSYAGVKYQYNSCLGSVYSLVEIHLHSVKEINGGQYQQGKVTGRNTELE